MSIRLSSFVLLPALAMSILVSCGEDAEPLTLAVLELEATPDIRERIELVEIYAVSRPAGVEAPEELALQASFLLTDGTGGFAFPLEVGLAPTDPGANEVFTLRALAFPTSVGSADGGAPIGEVRAQGSFFFERIYSFERVFEEGFCEGLPCEDSSTTCRDENCVDLTTGLPSTVASFRSSFDTFIKAEAPSSSDELGGSAQAFTADGQMLVAGAIYEASAPLSDPPDDSLPGSGGVFLYERGAEGYRQAGLFKAENAGVNDFFGQAVAVSADGSVVVVGAPGEASASQGLAGDLEDDSAPGAGAVYVFRRGGGGYALEAYLKASNAAAGDAFGTAVAVSADGLRIAVGAEGEASDGTGEANDDAPFAGAVYVFARMGGGWSQEGYLKASNASSGIGSPRGDRFGYALSLDATGQRLAVGAFGEDGAAGPDDDDARDAGAVYVFRRSGATWAEDAYLKASNAEAEDFFGYALAFDALGETLVVGALGEDGGSRTIDGIASSNEAPGAGAAYVFRRVGDAWRQEAYLKASNAAADAGFGSAVSVSELGDRIAVGAYCEATDLAGVVSDVALEDAPITGLACSGAAYVFERADEASTATPWRQTSFVKASNPDARDFLGLSVALSGDGRWLGAGARGEDGLSADAGDDSGTCSGAIYTYELVPES